MKIVVKNKGCQCCPFLYDADYPYLECDAAEYQGSTKRTTEANWDRKPDDCPFKNKGTIEVVAEKEE